MQTEHSRLRMSMQSKFNQKSIWAQDDSTYVWIKVSFCRFSFLNAKFILSKTLNCSPLDTASPDHWWLNGIQRYSSISQLPFERVSCNPKRRTSQCCCCHFGCRWLTDEYVQQRSSGGGRSHFSFYTGTDAETGQSRACKQVPPVSHLWDLRPASKVRCIQAVTDWPYPYYKALLVEAKESTSGS